MEIKCISTEAAHLSKSYGEGSRTIPSTIEIPLTVDQTYRVYALMFRDSQVWYCICDDDYAKADGGYYPMFWPAPFFEILDPSVSKYWHFTLTPEMKSHIAILAFPEWVEDKFFYDKLTDLEPEAIEIFQGYKDKMDLE